MRGGGGGGGWNKIKEAYKETVSLIYYGFQRRGVKTDDFFYVFVSFIYSF